MRTSGVLTVDDAIEDGWGSYYCRPHLDRGHLDPNRTPIKCARAEIERN
jgi:hypothetical protein